MGEQGFKAIGQISYLLYPEQVETVDQEIEEKLSEVEEEGRIDVSEKIKVEIPHFLSVLEKHHKKLRPREKVDLLCELFSIKPGEARDYIYAKYDSKD